MITIFHGDDQVKSREAFLAVTTNSFKLDSKSINLDQINNYLNEGSLFSDTKSIAISNYFSISKANLDKLTKFLYQTKVDVFLWQDKGLNATQTKLFSGAKIVNFRADNNLFACLNTLKPKNATKFMALYDKVIDNNLFDLFLYLLKGNFRRQLQISSVFDSKVIKRTYLQLIELEFQSKSGQLSLPKELALKRVVLPLLK